MRKVNLMRLVGALAITLGLLACPDASWATYGTFLSTANGCGMNQPAKVAVDSKNGDVYVTDAGNKKVKKYDKSGVGYCSFNLAVLGTPIGIAVNSTNIFVGDDDNDCIWIYDKNGNYADLTYTGTSHKLGGSAAAKVAMPNTITVGPSGHIFVVDGDNDRINIYNPNGMFEKSFGTSGSGTSTGTTIYLYFPTGLAMADNSDNGTTTTQNFYIGDNGNFRVQKLSYSYSDSTKTISTYPTFISNVGISPGSRVDSFGYFLNISDVIWDKKWSRIGVVDSFQSVVQQFDSNGTMNAAFNYTGSPGLGGHVAGYLKIPSGAAANSDFGGKLFVVNSQSDSLSLFDLTDGIPPQIISLSPASDYIPETSPYSISYTVKDQDSSALTLSFYYYESSSPLNRVLIGTTNITVTPNVNYTGAYSWSWAQLPAALGNYYVAADVTDEKGNMVESISAGRLQITNNHYACTNYTNVMKALYGDPTSDYDNDGLTNCEELNGTNYAAPAHRDASNTFTSDMSKADTDGDGLTDWQEVNSMQTVNTKMPDNTTLLGFSATSCPLDPRNPDTDGGGLSDFIELKAGKNPCNPADDANITPQAVGAPINIGTYNYDTYAEWHNTDGTSTVWGDVVMRRSDGTIAAKTTIGIPPNGTKVIRVGDYTSENNLSVDFVSVGAKYVVGTFECYLLSPYDGQVLDDLFDKMDLTGAPKLEMNAANFGNNRYLGWLCLRNPSVTNSVNIQVDYYNSTTAGWVKTSTYTIPANSAKVISPNTDEGLANGQYNATITGLNGNVCGYLIQVRKNSLDSNILDQAMAVPFEEEPASILTWDTYNDGKWRFEGWIGMKNINAVPVTIDVTHTDVNGKSVGTSAKSFFPHQSTAWRPSVSDEIPGGQYSAKMQVTPTGLAAVGGITDVSVNAGGSGYAVNDVLSVTQSGSSNGLVKVTSVSGGVVTGLSIVAIGSGYTTASGLATAETATGAPGTGCKVNITAVSVVGAGGSGYAIGDLLPATTGTGGVVRVSSVTSGAVTGLGIISAGSGYSTGMGQATGANSLRSDGGIRSVSVVFGGTGYVVNDILTVTQSGASAGQVKVTSASGGVVTGVSIYAAGSGYNTGSGLATTGGTGLGCTLWISSSSVTVTAGGSGYAVNDVLTVSGGTGGKVRVMSVSGGAVTVLKVESSAPGYGYTTGAGKATTGGTGTGCTVNVAAVTGSGCTVNVTAVNPSNAVMTGYAQYLRYNGTTPSAIDFQLGLGLSRPQNGIVTAGITAGGSGYTVNDVLAVSGGVNGKATVTSVNGGGTVTGISINTAGCGYSTGAGQATTGGTGSGCTVNITGLTYGISGVSVTGSGSGYAVNNILNVSGGSGGQVKVTSVGGGGSVTGLSMSAPGTGYNTGAGQATTGGSGTGCTVNITALTYGYTTLYAPHWTDAGDGAGKFTTYECVKNPDTINSVNVICYFYDMNGNLVGNSGTVTVQPSGRFVWRAFDYSIPVTEGSAKVVATGPVTGWMQRMKFNAMDATLNDSGGAGWMIPTP